MSDTTPTPSPAPTEINYQTQYKRAIDWAWTSSASFSSSDSAITRRQDALRENTSYDFRVLAEGSRYSQPVSMATTSSAATQQAPDGTFISHEGETFTDAAGNVWGLTSVGTNNPYVVTVNGDPDTSTTAQNVLMLAMVSNTIHLQNKSYLWFAKQMPSQEWQAVGDPRVGVPTVLSLPGNLQVGNVPPTAISYHGGPVLDNCNLTLVYWGTAWNSLTAKPSRFDVSNAVRAMVSSTYFDGMTEYGIQDPPIIVNDIVTTRVPTPQTVTPTPAPSPTPTPTPAGG